MTKKTATATAAHCRKVAAEVRAMKIQGSTREKREHAEGFAEVFAQWNEKRAQWIDTYGNDRGFGEVFFAPMKIKTAAGRI